MLLVFISWHYILDQNSRTRFTLGAVGSCGLCAPHEARHQHELQLDSETIIICSVLNSRAAHTLVHEPPLQPALYLFTFNCWLWDRVMLCCLCCHWPGPHCSPCCPRTHSSGSALVNLPSTGITGMLSHTTLKQKIKICKSFGHVEKVPASIELAHRPSLLTFWNRGHSGGHPPTPTSRYSDSRP